MSENNKELPEKFTNAQHIVDAAHKGLGIREIAARCGMSVAQLRVFFARHPEAEIAYENARADVKQRKLDRINHVETQAEAKEDWSLVYKINHEALKRMAEEEAVFKVQVVQPQDAGIPEPEYEDLSEEQLAAIREQTERADRGSQDE